MNLWPKLFKLFAVDDLELIFKSNPNQSLMDWRKMLQIQQQTQFDILACCLGAQNMTPWSFSPQYALPHLLVREQARAEWFC